MEGLKERIEELKGELHLTTNALATKCGLGPSNFSRKMNGKDPWKDRDLMLLSQCYGISEEWLRTGRGEKYTTKPKEVAPTDGNGQPFYDVDFALGYSEFLDDTPAIPSRYISVPGYEKVDFWCRTSGNSMTPAISNGDIIALKEVTGWAEFLAFNEIYAIVTTDDMRTVKIVRRGSSPDTFTLHAINEEYEDQEISKASIRKIFKVIGAIKTL